MIELSSCPVLKTSISFHRKDLRPTEIFETHTVYFFYCVCLHTESVELQLGFVSLKKKFILLLFALCTY